MIEEFPRLLSGLLFGVVFGFLLQKGQVAKFGVIVRQLTLQQWTVAKLMATAVIVGGVGIYAMLPSDTVELYIKPLSLGGMLFGGACFGAGLAVLGYCPGTGVAACGEGRRDAMIGVLGMLFGSGVYVLTYSAMQTIEGWRNYGPHTLPSLTDVSAWIWFAIGTAVFVALALVGREWTRKGEAQGG